MLRSIIIPRSLSYSVRRFASAAASNGSKPIVTDPPAKSTTHPADGKLEHVHFAAEKPPSAEYHRHSTRYYRSSREVLSVLEEEWRQPAHPPAQTGSDVIAIALVKFLRKATDLYFKDRLVLRAVMLETVAAVPGFVSGMVHHLRSLRNLKTCYHLKALTAEAENERMHLMSFLAVLKPSRMQRLIILGVQGVFLSVYLPAYIIFPGTAHRFVSALEVEACATYSHLLQMIDDGRIQNYPAPAVARDYWNMPEDATLRDMVLTIRADEADHVLVNQYMADSVRGRRGPRKSGTEACEEFEIDMHEPFGPIFHPDHKQHFEPKQAKQYTH